MDMAGGKQDTGTDNTDKDPGGEIKVNTRH